MRPGTRPAGKNEKTQDRFHVSAAPGAREAVQAEQVPVQAEEVRGRHQSDANRNASESPGIRPTPSFLGGSFPHRKSRDR